ncbi:MAG TPA: hypothetical protein VLJ83_06575 [Gemmatimonadaceae bacterium]|nr:hypothetical protein [Gemmatimonadaceae bacterium]
MLHANVFRTVVPDERRDGICGDLSRGSPLTNRVLSIPNLRTRILSGVACFGEAEFGILPKD